jgi:hypothetical protein
MTAIPGRREGARLRKNVCHAEASPHGRAPAVLQLEALPVQRCSEHRHISKQRARLL